MSPAKKPRRPAAWVPPAGLRVEVFVERGDVSLKAEAAVGDVLPVAKLLIACVRQVAADAPDVLPHADSVPGMVLPVVDDEGYEYQQQPRPVGFTVSSPPRRPSR